jgi:hypothetical protein
MMKYSIGWTKESLFSCFTKNKVEFGLDYCLYKFNVSAAVLKIDKNSPDR